MAATARSSAIEMPVGTSRAVLWAAMATGERRIGRVVRRKGRAAERWMIDFGRKAEVRYLTSFRGAVFESRHMATAILAHIELEVAKGRELADVVGELAPTARGAGAVKPLVDRWLALFEAKVEAGERQPRTLVQYRRWADPTTGWWRTWYGRSIYEIDTGALEEWSLWLHAAGLAPKSRLNVMLGFSSFLSWLPEVRRGWRPPARIPWPQLDERLPTVLSLTERDAVLEAIPEPRRGIYLFLAWTGARPGEARALRVRDWTGDWIRVAQAAKDDLAQGERRSTKRRREKVLPVEAPVREWLELHVSAARRLEDPDGPLFANPDGWAGGWWAPTSLRKAWRRACVKAGVPVVGLYEGTKHTLATALAEAGVEDREIAQLLGHANVTSVQPYRLLRPEGARRALARLRPDPT